MILFRHNDWDFDERSCFSLPVEDNAENNIISTDEIEHPGHSGSDQQEAGNDTNDGVMCQDCFL